MAVGREVRATVLVGAVGAEDWEQIKLMAAAQGAVGADGVEIHAALIKVMVGGKPWCCEASDPARAPGHRLSSTAIMNIIVSAPCVVVGAGVLRYVAGDAIWPVGDACGALAPAPARLDEGAARAGS